MVAGIRCIVFFLVAVTRLVTQSAYLVGQNTQPKYRDSLRNSASSVKVTHVFKEAATEILPHHLIVKKDRVLSSQIHDVIFTVKQRNMDKLVEILNDVSDIRSPNYGKHMTSEEIADLTSNLDSRDEVVAYLKAAGASVVSESPYGEYITASAPISLWEHMLDAEFYTYSLRGETVRNYMRAERYSVPIRLNEHVDSVLNTIQRPTRAQSSPASSASVSRFDPLLYIDPNKNSKGQKPWTAIRRFMDPSLLSHVYNIDSNDGHPHATQAILGGPDQFFSPTDLLNFQEAN